MCPSQPVGLRTFLQGCTAEPVATGVRSARVSDASPGRRRSKAQQERNADGTGGARTVGSVTNRTHAGRPGRTRFLCRVASCSLIAAVLTTANAHAEPREPVGDATPVTVETEETSSVAEGLPTVVGELLELRIDAQEAITEAEIARAAAERARVSARATRFTATVARLRARHARDILERWAAGLYRNEIGVHTYVDVLETGIMQPERTLDVAHWLGLVGQRRENEIDEAARLVEQAERLERLAFASLSKAEQAEEYANIRRAEADIILESTETALRAAVGDDFKHQLTIGPDGCPTSAPEGSIRYGAPEEVARLCARSVALAATPEAALAIKYAFRALGAQYACDGIGRDLPMRYDCSSLVARAYAEGAGLLTATETWIPTTRNLLPWDGMTQAAWARTIDPEEALPGDLVLYDTEHLASRHVVMLLADGHMLHVAECGDISHVTGFWGYGDGTGYRYLGTRRVDPMLARDPANVLDGTDPWLTDGVHTEPETPSNPDTAVAEEPDEAATGGDEGEPPVDPGITDETSEEPETDTPPVRTGPENIPWGTDRIEGERPRDHEEERVIRRYYDQYGVR